MTGLVLEGGTFRGTFSAGFMDALIEENIEFPYIVGGNIQRSLLRVKAVRTKS